MKTADTKKQSAIETERSKKQPNLSQLKLFEEALQKMKNNLSTWDN
jgi:hypothetical protein